MDIKIAQKPAFAVAGILLEAIDNSLCPSAWNQLLKNILLKPWPVLGMANLMVSAQMSKKGKSSITWLAMM